MKPENEQRRFPRVHFRRDYGASDRITKAHVHWKNYEFSDVFDLSLGGLAASRPSLLEFKVGDVLEVTLELGEHPAFTVKAEMVWLRDFSLGLSFRHLEPQGHVILRQFLNDKLVGSHLRKMKEDLYPKDADFDLWYSGPRETHVFLKLKKGGDLPLPVLKAEVLVDGDRFEYLDGKIMIGESLRSSVVQILNHAPESEPSLQTLLEQILKDS